MLKVILLGMLTCSLFSAVLEIKKGDVNASVNSKEVLFKKDTIIDIEEGSVVKYLSGEGKLFFPEFRKVLKEKEDYFSVPIPTKKANEYFRFLKDTFVVVFLDSTETRSTGGGTKDIGNSFLIGYTETELLIFSQDVSGLPIIAILKDKNGNDVLSFKNEESDVSLFRISKKMIKSGMSINVYNGFEELLLQQNID